MPEPLNAFEILLAYYRDLEPADGDTLADYRFNDEPLEDYGDWQGPELD